MISTPSKTFFILWALLISTARPATVTHYDFEEGSGTVYVDSSRLNNDATAVAGALAWSNNGKVGKAGLFNGSTCAQLNNVLSTVDSFTITMWIQSSQQLCVSCTSPQWTQGAGLLDGYISGAANSLGTSLLNGTFAFGTSSPQETVRSSQAYNDGSWHFFAAVRNSSASPTTLFVMTDLATNQITSANTASFWNSSTFTLGCLNDLTNQFVGLVDELSIFDTALNIAELTDIMNSAVSTTGQATTGQATTGQVTTGVATTGIPTRGGSGSGTASPTTNAATTATTATTGSTTGTTGIPSTTGTFSGRYEVIVTIRTSNFNAVSFVNAMATIMSLSPSRIVLVSATAVTGGETIDIGIIDDGTESAARAISTLQYDYAQDKQVFQDNGLDVTNLQIVDHNAVTTEAPVVQQSSSVAVADTSAIIAAVLIPVGTILIIIAIIAIYEYRKRWKARHSADVEMGNVKPTPAPSSPKKKESESEGESSGESGSEESKSESSDEGSSSEKEDPKKKNAAKKEEPKKKKESSEEESASASASASASKQSEDSQSESGSESD